MKLKASLHLHSSEDVLDGLGIDYDLYRLIDVASSKGFKVLASTCHRHNVCQPGHIAYAAERGVLLWPGVEAEFSGFHILIINGDADAEKLKDIEDLRRYKQQHPEVLVIAPHPNHIVDSIGMSRLDEWLPVIDAVELSWFYGKSFNPNKKVVQWCKRHNVPYLATSDAHKLNYLDTDFAVIDAELNARAIIDAIKNRRFQNISRPKNFSSLLLKQILLFIKIRWLNLTSKKRKP